jgi:class 3 adenylate cyclase
VSRCPSCGHENEAEARFCSRCGTPLDTARPPARAERKVLTVLFADLVGFTSRAERLDPEDVQAVLAPYHARLREELERWGGTVEKFIGDAVMALFGAPVAREDDAERAVRAAVAIRDWVAEEGQLQVRIGVNTGEALVNLAARPEAGEGMAAGDVINTAARLQAAAPANGILVGESTYRATGEAIDYRGHAAVEAKGKDEPVPVWEAVQARARFGVDLAPGARTPLVGRERELDQLTDALERVRQRRAPELVTLVGVPGIGKSRLVGELFASVERGGELTHWRQGRSLPYGEGVSYWALAEMVKAQTGILETDGEGDVEAKLARAVEQLVPEDADWVRSRLRPLVGQADEAAAGSQEESFAAWRRFLEALAEQRPLVLVFEDLQWADDGLLDFVEHLAEWVQDVPLLIVCTARPELLERRPAWGGGKVNAATLSLPPLSADETARLLSALADRPLLDAETQSALLERAGGNPLYAEQYVRMLAERRGDEGLPLPESIHGIIAARLDSLAPSEKALLQDAAVVGKVFWLGVLGATEVQLHALRQKEFVQRARRSSVEGETEYAFRHVLVRDVAYGQIPRALRAEKHVRTARWIESLGRPEDHAEMVAHHYVSALELSRAAGRDDEELRDRTRAALRDAGDRAATLNALPQAEAYLRRALELTPSTRAERARLLLRLGRICFLRYEEGAEELAEARDGLLAAGDREAAAEAELLLADIGWRRGRRDEVLAHLEAARSLVAGSPPSRVHASVLASVVRYEMLDDHDERAIALGREALGLAEQLGLEDLRANVLNSVGCARSNLGDRRGLHQLEESIAVAAAANAVNDVLRGHNNLIPMSVLYGDLERAEGLTRETVRLCRHYGHHGFLRFMAGGATIMNPYHAGDWDEARRSADAFLAEVERGSPHYQAATAYCFRGLMRLGRGEAGAAEDAERGLAIARPIGDPQSLHPTLAMASFVFLGAGEEGHARETLDEALERLGVLAHLGFAAVELHHLAWTALRLGRGAEVLAVAEREPFRSSWTRAVLSVAAGDLRGAADSLGGIGAATAEAFYRLRLAERLSEEGHRAEAEEQLLPALAFYRSVRAARYVREGERLLAASAEDVSRGARRRGP